MALDWTLNVGDVVQLAVLLAAFVGAHVSNRERLARIETQIEAVEKRLDRERR